MFSGQRNGNGTSRKKDEAGEPFFRLTEAANDEDCESLFQRTKDVCRRSVNIVVDRVAELMPEYDLKRGEDTVLAVNGCFLVSPIEGARGYRATLPIVQAMPHVDYDETDVYTAGVRQFSWIRYLEKTKDSADRFRGVSAMAILRSRIASPAATLQTLTICWTTSAS